MKAHCKLGQDPFILLWSLLQKGSYGQRVSAQQASDCGAELSEHRWATDRGGREESNTQNHEQPWQDR